MFFCCVDRFSFEMDINPSELSTAQHKGVRNIKRGGKYIPMFYKKASTLRDERRIDCNLKKHIGKTKRILNDGNTSVNLRVVYLFPHTSTTPKWKRDQLTFMTQRPDADNLSKTLVDRMTVCGFWEDDSMVNFNFVKFRSPKPCIKICIETWKQFRTEEEMNEYNKQLP